ncbi:transmembrane protein 18-like [Littorina saxatilis]|uniref:Transmembrane protein 18 n=1 Tax=Littorina saxatilis TaxID=31220 RepID=A0AAN9ARF8_9CAEN
MQQIRTDEITGLWTYLASIDWSEPWFLALGVFHVTCFLATYLTRNHLTIQGIVFACFLALVGCSEYINGFAAKHAGEFARQQYFDSNGLFISVVFSVPILVNCLIIVVLWLMTSANLMGSIRRKQLIQQRHLHKQQQEQQQQDQSGVEGVHTKDQDTGDADSGQPGHKKQE